MGLIPKIIFSKTKIFLGKFYTYMNTKLCHSFRHFDKMDLNTTIVPLTDAVLIGGLKQKTVDGDSTAPVSLDKAAKFVRSVQN